MPLFITALSLFIPIIMIVFGILMWFAPPKGRSTSYGYRTKRSMMNEETWDYAQACMGKSWFIVGIVLIGVTLFLLPRIALDHGSLIITILSIQVVFLCVPFIWIEFLLSRHFKWKSVLLKERCLYKHIILFKGVWLLFYFIKTESIKCRGISFNMSLANISLFLSRKAIGECAS